MGVLGVPDSLEIWKELENSLVQPHSFQDEEELVS